MTIWHENRFQVLSRDNCHCQSCGKWPAGLVHGISLKRKGDIDGLSCLNTVCGRCYMLVNSVPDWIVARVWKIAPANIPLERKMVSGRIKRKIELRNVAK